MFGFLQLLDRVMTRVAHVSLTRRLDRMRNRPEHVAFPQLIGDPPRHIVTLAVTADQCLTADELQLMRLYGRGVMSWWLRHSAHEFAALDLPRGDTPFTRTLSLPEGRYTLGVGRGRAARRITFDVTSDGSLVRSPSPRTEAHADTFA